MRRIPVPVIVLVLALLPAAPGAAPAQDNAAAGARVTDDAERQLKEALAADPGGEAARRLGDFYASRDRHAEAIAAYRTAAAKDPALRQEILAPLGAQLLWADRAPDAVPLLEEAALSLPNDAEVHRLLALAYRWSGRHRESERIYRKLLAADPGDVEARKGLAEAQLWRGRYGAASMEYGRVLGERPEDAEALLGQARANYFQDLPEEAASFAERGARVAPNSPEVRDLREKIAARRKPFRLIAELWLSHDSDDLTLFEAVLGARARPSRGMDLAAEVRQSLFHQAAPGREVNLDEEDSVSGTAGSLLLTHRSAPWLEWRAGAGLARYDTGDFHPWTGRAGISLIRDARRVDLDWERIHFDTILSFQNRVTADSVSLSAAAQIGGRTELRGTAALLFHHNENATGQNRENRGYLFAAEARRVFAQKGDAVYLAGLLRLGWLGFDEDLDVGVFDPERYTTEEIGVDARWGFRPRWSLFGTLWAGLQQEKGLSGEPTYSAEAGLDRAAGRGLVTLLGFASDSSAAGRGGGYHRAGMMLRVQLPF